MTKMILMNSMMFMVMKHPITMGTILMTQTIILSTSMFKNSSMSWFSYILFITMIGGLMIMFIYMSSIASNEKFKSKKKLMIWMFLAWMILLFVTKNEMITEEQKLNPNKMTIMENSETMIVSKFFNKNKMSLTIMIMIMLLITMVSVTNIVMTFSGPLKKTYV